ncbi:OLC1v1003310C1 [Oldenlandia corymbosa var. corymbosa]|uniref:OLC1v1003310C1 n=1 Tax=Oldenlandia corymbosa var. corymbosa TaxID=529605 RepID=A0AAV1DC50_OLDCO|nr:OLC1v1003310C1 [Oldenlandia corymbosa var. corymbosa]
MEREEEGRASPPDSSSISVQSGVEIYNPSRWGRQGLGLESAILEYVHSSSGGGFCSVNVEEYHPATKIQLISSTPSSSTWSSVCIHQEKRRAAAKTAAAKEEAAKEAAPPEAAAAKDAAAKEAAAKATAKARADEYADIRERASKFAENYSKYRMQMVYDTGKWSRYYQLMHNSQGFDITWSPDRSYKATIQPFPFKDIDGKIKPNFLKMSQDSIQFYNNEHDKEKYIFDGKVQNVAYFRTPFYTLYYITFTAQVDHLSSPEPFLGRYFVNRRRSTYRPGDLKSRPLFCMRRDLFLSDWEQKKDELCTLGCCTPHRTFLEYILEEKEDKIPQEIKCATMSSSPEETEDFQLPVDADEGRQIPEGQQRGGAQLDQPCPASVSPPELVHIWGKTSRPGYLEQYFDLLSTGIAPDNDMILRSGSVSNLVELLSGDDSPGLQFEAAWVLGNIASGTSDDTKVAIDHGAVPIFVKLLGSPNDDVREQAIWALGNIAGDSPRYRDLVLSEGALVCAALPNVQLLVYFDDFIVLSHACWALLHLSDGSNDVIQSLIKAGVYPRLVELISHPSPYVRLPALRTVGNIARENNFQRQAAVIDDKLIEEIIHLLQTEDTSKKEVGQAILNIIFGGTRVRIPGLEGFTKPLCDLLDSPDPVMANVGLEGIGILCKPGGERTNLFVELIGKAKALAKIKALRIHDNKEISRKAFKIWGPIYCEAAKIWSTTTLMEDLLLDVENWGKNRKTKN